MDLDKFRLPYREDTAFGLIIFCLFLVPLVFSLYSYENFESVKFSLFLILTGCSLAVFLMQKKSGRQGWQYNKYFFWLLSAFFIWGLASAFLAQDRVYSFIGFYYRYTSGVLFYAVLLVFIFLLVNLLNRERLIFLLKVLVVDALAVAIIAYLQSFGWIFYAGVGATDFFRGPSLLGNANYSAMFLACILPLVVYFFKEAKTLYSRLYYAATGFFLIFGSLLLSSRGALLAIVVAVVVVLGLLLFSRFPKKFFWALLISFGLVCVLGGFLLNISRPQAVSGVVAGSDVNTSTRFYAWEVSLKGIEQYPIFGVGPGNYALFFEQKRLPTQISDAGVFDDAHNLFLQLAVTGGLPLVVLFIGIILLSVFYGLRQFYKEKDLFSLALIAGLIIWVIACCFNPVPIPMYLVLGVFLTGVSLNYFKTKETDFKFWQKFIFIALAWLIAFFGLASLVSEHLLGFAAASYASGEYSESYNSSRAAYFINPSNGLSLTYETASGVYLDKPESSLVSGIKKIQNLHPTQAETFVAASNLYDIAYSQTHNKAYLESAAENMQAAINIDPLFSQRYGQLALYYYQLGNLEQSRLNVDKDLALDQTDFSAFVLSAKLFQLQNNKQATIDALNNAFKINPNISQLKYILYLARTLPNISQVPIDIQIPPPSI